MNENHMHSEELIEVLAEGKNVRIERIVSRGHASPPDFWYDQDTHEFVLLVQGEARLVFEEGPELVYLKAGDFLDIPAHRKHRVDWTLPDQDTVWLAVHYEVLQ
ncbi:MAG: phosphoribosylaminoimidazole carboxylase [Candidatus Omnitrophica bacterium]|nr:phosphoribosylaminoimidazole carboxylase [Candidatus Omnitrophota bacterium]